MGQILVALGDAGRNPYMISQVTTITHHIPFLLVVVSNLWSARIASVAAIPSSNASSLIPASADGISSILC